MSSLPHLAAPDELASSVLAEALRPEPPMTVTEWSDTFAQLTPPSKETGQYRSSRTPYLREIMDNLSPASPVQTTAVMKGAQLGVTRAALNWIGFSIDQSPAGIVYIGSSLAKVREMMQTTVDPMIRGTACLRRKVSTNRRDGTNTNTLKVFDGGSLLALGSNSPDMLKSSTAGRLIVDELDAWELDNGAGDPLQLARRLMRTFGRRKKELLISTPAEHESSRIRSEFEAGDQRYYHLPCPHCGFRFRLVWTTHIKWDEGDPSSAHAVCTECAAEIDERYKPAMLAAGEWIPSAPDRVCDERRTYHLSAMYSPHGMRSWAEMAADFLATKDNPPKLRVFMNEDLGLPWKLKVQRPDWERLFERREEYRRGTVPEGAWALTAGVDSQEDRLEIEIVAWGRRRETWSVDYIVLNGDTSGDEVWDELDRILANDWPLEIGGTMRIAIMAVDAGFRPNSTYLWARRHDQRKAMPVRGRILHGAAIGRPQYKDVEAGGKAIKNGAQVWPVGVDTLTEELYSSIVKEPPEGADTRVPYGLCHWPMYDRGYFEQLCSHRCVKREQKRKIVWVWEKEPFKRDEALDCRNYATAAAITLGVDRWSEAQWDELEAAIRAAQQDEPDEHRRWRRRRDQSTGSYFDTWR